MKIKMKKLRSFMRNFEPLPLNSFYSNQIKLFFGCLALLCLLLHSSSSYAQYPSNVDNPGVVLKAKQYHSYLSDGLSSTSSDHREEWLFDVIESSDGESYYSAGFTDPPFGTSGNRRRPAIVKFDKDLEKLWDINYEDITVSGIDYWIRESKFTELIEDDHNMIYAVGNIKIQLKAAPYTTSHWMGIVTKLDKNGNTQSGFPQVIFKTMTMENRTDAIIIDDNNDHIFISGKQDGEMWLGKYDKSFNLITETNFANTLGRGWEMCFNYPSGSLPGRRPVVANQQASNIMLTGCVTVGTSGPNTLDVFVYKIDMSNLSILASTIFDSQNYTNYNLFDWPRNTAVCPNISGIENFNDIARSIEQNVNGDFLIGAMYNWQRALTNVTCINVSNPETPCHKREQIEAADAVLFSIDDNLSTLSTKHIGRFEGDDFWFSAKFDYAGNIYALGTTANPDRTLNDPHCTANTGKCQDNFMLLKYNYDDQSTSGNFFDYAWHKEFYGGDESSSCGFDLLIDDDNNVVCVGNNHFQHENWDIVKISDDCALNGVLPTPNTTFLPNAPNHVFSVKKYLDANAPGQTVLTIGSDKVIKSQIVIDYGYTLRVPYNWGNTLEFYDAQLFEDNFVENSSYYTDAGIVIDGGTLEIKGGAELTSISSACFDTWGGVYLFVGDFIMENATISNARVGLNAYQGSSVKATNTILPVPDPTDPQNPNSYLNVINFKNNNISIWYPGNTFMPTSTLKLLNFKCDDRTTYNRGLDYFIKFRNGFDEKLKVEGCVFENEYFDKLGMCTGISSFGGGLDILFADLNQGTTNCKPNLLRQTRFSDLYTAIANGYTTHNRNIRMRVAEVDFDNNKEAIIDGVGTNSFIWGNEIHWDDREYNFEGHGDKLGVYNSWGWGTEILENNISNTHDENFLAIYTSQNAWHSSFGGQNVTGNVIENASIAPHLGIGHKINSDNTHMQITCNTYTGLYKDWYVTGDLPTQEISGGHNQNRWTKWGGFNFSDIHDITASPVEYWCDPDPQSIGHPEFSTPLVVQPIMGIKPFGECPIKTYCDVYSGLEENWNIIASQAQPTHPVDEVLGHLFNGDADLAEKSINSLETSEIYEGIDQLISTLLPASRENRLYRLKANEITALKQIAAKSSYTGQLAKDVLFHFADVRSTRDTYTGDRLPEDELNENTASEEKTELVDKVKLYPNPATDKLTIQTGGDETYHAEVMDVSGKLIRTFDGTSNTAVDISSLSVGVYFIQVQTLEGKSVHKLFIE